MSDATAPSAAEVVGGPHTHGRPHFICWCDIDDFPDVDQMLVWLVGRPEVDEPQIWWDDGEGNWVLDPGILLSAATYRAPTLHAALEQAVIAVGRAE